MDIIGDERKSAILECDLVDADAISALVNAIQFCFEAAVSGLSNVQDEMELLSARLECALPVSSNRRGGFLVGCGCGALGGAKRCGQCRHQKASKDSREYHINLDWG